MRGFYRMKTPNGNRIGRYLRTSDNGLHFFRACDGKTPDMAIEVLVAHDTEKLTPVRENRKYGNWEMIPKEERDASNR